MPTESVENNNISVAIEKYNQFTAYRLFLFICKYSASTGIRIVTRLVRMVLTKMTTSHKHVSHKTTNTQKEEKERRSKTCIIIESAKRESNVSTEIMRELGDLSRQ